MTVYRPLFVEHDAGEPKAAEPMEQRISRLYTRQRAKRGEVALVSPLDFWIMARRAGGQVEADSWRMSIMTPVGVVRVISDPDCPRDYIQFAQVPKEML